MKRNEIRRVESNRISLGTELLTNGNLNTSFGENVERGLGDEAGAAIMTLLVGEGHLEYFFSRLLLIIIILLGVETYSSKARWGAIMVAIRSIGG